MVAAGSLVTAGTTVPAGQVRPAPLLKEVALPAASQRRSSGDVSTARCRTRRGLRVQTVSTLGVCSHEHHIARRCTGLRGTLQSKRPEASQAVSSVSLSHSTYGCCTGRACVASDGSRTERVTGGWGHGVADLGGEPSQVPAEADG